MIFGGETGALGIPRLLTPHPSSCSHCYLLALLSPMAAPLLDNPSSSAGPAWPPYLACCPLTLVESLLIVRRGWRAMLQDIVCGLLSAHQELNETMQKYRESTLHRFGPMGRKKVGDGQILPESFSMLWTPLRYSLSLQIFWGKIPTC